MDFSFRVVPHGTVGRSGVTLRISNAGPPRAFYASLTSDCGLEARGASDEVGRMSEGDVVLRFPGGGPDSPREARFEAAVSPAGTDETETRSFAATYLPEGWFDRLDPSLCDDVRAYAESDVPEAREPAGVREDLRRAYESQSGIAPREDTTERFFRVAPPSMVREYLDATEAESAVLLISDMAARGHRCSLSMLGGEAYVCVSENGAAGAVRPSDGCRGVPFEVSEDGARARLRRTLNVEHLPIE